MAVLPVNPNRMELARLKKRLAASTRGHKLLKDKRDDMMKKFLELIRENMELREELEKKMDGIYEGFVMAGAVMDEAVLGEALMLPQRRVSVRVKISNVMGVRVPDFDFDYDYAQNASGNIYPYGLAFTSAELDSSVRRLSDALPLLLKLARVEKTARLLAEEIEKTRRRVNALEYVQIPSLRETIKSITMKLDENERGNLARLMKVKDMMIARQRGDSLRQTEEQ